MLRSCRLFLALVALFGMAGLAVAGPVNVNTADADTLSKELTGVGPALAAAIIRDREENGPFKSPEDLARVSGIGPSVLEKNKENIRTEDEAPVPADS